jgi:YidC/Oxa1 family membrane protein insertase
MGQLIDAIADLFSIVLSYIYTAIPNFGISIIILTLLVKLITFPLNNKQIQSAKRMQELQPEIKRIQAKYKNDKEKQNRAMTEFMQENKINPLAGCLPLLIQFPILIGMFRLLSQADKFILPRIESFNSFLVPSLEFIDLLHVEKFEAANLLNPVSLVYYVFPIIAGITTFIYQKQTMGDTNQKMMLYMMPAMIVFFSFSFPAGLVLYWILNNLFSMGQHYIIGYMEKIKEGNPEETGKKGDKQKK